MSCNTCAKAFSLLRKEKGCPGCGFSHCSKCLEYKVYVPKLKAETKVCSKCKNSLTANEKQEVKPPDAYYKRIGGVEKERPDVIANTNAAVMQNTTDHEILCRLQKLKEDKVITSKIDPSADIAERLKKLKGEMPSTSDAELHDRLARLKGAPQIVQSKPVLPMPDLRTEQEQIDDLMKQYAEQVKIDTKYRDEFESVINDIENRIQSLKDQKTPTTQSEQSKQTPDSASEDEDEIIKKIIEKAKAESLLEAEVSNEPSSSNEELPFCEICNEDARMRCLGCKYLYCKQCFLEHKDDDDGCNRYEPYNPPKEHQ